MSATILQGHEQLTEFTNGSQAGKSGTDGETGETRLGDGGLSRLDDSREEEKTYVDDTILSEFVEQTLGDLWMSA